MFDRNRYYDYESNTLKENLIADTLRDIAFDFGTKSLTETKRAIDEISQAIDIYLMAYDDNPQLQEIADLLTAGR